MAAKGSATKNMMFQKLLQAFPNSFMYNDNKELRVNFVEDGEQIQLKVTLTAAKVPVQPPEDNDTVPFETSTSNVTSSDEVFDWSMPAPTSDIQQAVPEPTAEEKKNVQDLMKALGF